LHFARSSKQRPQDAVEAFKDAFQQVFASPCFPIAFKLQPSVGDLG
jgi:hypothetical protein